jgi:branched-chain amino acid transport system permease protein
MVETFVNLIVQGVLIGGLYALFALGLSLSLGVMRFVNIAHGDMIVLFSFVILSLTGALGWSPFLVALILIPVAFGAGYVLQRFLLQRTVGKGILPILLVTFGLSIIIQNGLLEAYGPNTRKLSGGAIELAAFRVGPIDIGVYPLLVLGLAVALIAGLDTFLYRTAIGARIRAVSDDPAAGDLIGLTSARIYPIAMGVIAITMLAAASCMSVWTNFDPAIGPSRLLAAFEAVVLGGLGSLWGTLAGGVIIGIAQNFGSQIDASWQILAQHLVFLVALILRPQGLFARG